eukprot:c26365_g1_i1.p2 GENE.c26365_g1_i1~~c26365_g1_i1.p2  ORF type:complete len:129 (-),score=20.83 c26365_g1_i1:155-541(-)
MASFLMESASDWHQNSTSPQHVSHLAHKFETGMQNDDPTLIQPRPRTGNPTAVTAEHMAALEAFAVKSLGDFTWNEAARVVGVAASTLHRHAIQAGWRLVSSRYVPSLSPNQISQRLLWATTHQIFLG